ncbi:MAG: type transport system ATP-binding protein [Frankiales bacterium]|jgi:ABC-2 type transport system ATP-binding protein|nr:type transport system ATP-binding protein [Frankiales bacterium]
MTAAVQAVGLGKRYGKKWALQDATFDIPAGRVCGLVGANGAGKTTLLRMLAGLSKPTAGSAIVEGRVPGDEVAFLSQVGYLAQEVPLYVRWTTEDHLRMGAALNPRWDDKGARDRLESLGIPFDQRVGTLSGGQRAQVALAIALSKKPSVLLLDEPVAALDPLARRDFLSTLTEAVADTDLTVILSTHLVSDLERVCDHLVVLDAAHTMLAEGVDEVMATHRLLTAARRDIRDLERDHTVLRVEQTPRQVSVWVKLEGPVHDPLWQVSELGLEDIVLAYLDRGRRAAGRATLQEVTA